MNQTPSIRPFELDLLIQPTAGEAQGARRFALMRVLLNNLCPTTLKLSIRLKAKHFLAGQDVIFKVIWGSLYKTGKKKLEFEKFQAYLSI